MVSQDFLKLQEYILNEYTIKKIFPEQKKIFRALDITPFSNVRVVILGQDPYHDEQQANGLSFSVNDNVKLPPSLKNIYKEIEGDLGVTKDFANGNLENWATQGVLL
jgi:uracil-DNA glycosylase